MFSTGKISSYVSFPLDDLEMAPYLHTSEKSKHLPRRETQYELNSIICHYGSSNGGHYIGYGRNYLNDEWYEYYLFKFKNQIYMCRISLNQILISEISDKYLLRRLAYPFIMIKRKTK